MYIHVCMCMHVVSWVHFINYGKNNVHCVHPGDTLFSTCTSGASGCMYYSYTVVHFLPSNCAAVCLSQRVERCPEARGDAGRRGPSCY